MAFTGSFSIVQNSESTFTITDDSQGTDTNLFERRIYLYKYDGTTIVPTDTATTYIDFPIVTVSGDTITLTDILDKDYALNIQINWNTSIADPDSVYVANLLCDFTWYSENFAALLTSEAAARYPQIRNNKNYFYSKIKFRVLVDDSAQAVQHMNDIYKAQFCLTEANSMIQNPSQFF